MKYVRSAIAVLTTVLLVAGPLAHAQTSPQPRQPSGGVMAMDANKDGMISKQEYMRMMEAKFDEMDKGKTGKLTPAQVQQSISEIGKTYGYSN